jgi:hypothetical protein
MMDSGAAKQLATFIARFDDANQKLIRSVRAALRKRMPAANELVYDNYNFFVIGYSSSERPSDCIVSLSANAHGLNLNFYWGATLPDPDRLLEGGGTQNRFLRIASASDLARPEIEALLAAAIAQGKVPLPVRGRGKLIIRMISGKQRPRRKTGT